jgi:hypothetical protein
MNHQDLCTFLNSIPNKPEFLGEWTIVASADHTAIFQSTDCPPGEVGTGTVLQLYRAHELVATGLTGTDIPSKHVVALGLYMVAVESACASKLNEQEPPVDAHPVP